MMPIAGKPIYKPLLLSFYYLTIWKRILFIRQYFFLTIWLVLLALAQQPYTVIVMYKTSHSTAYMEERESGLIYVNV